MQNHPMQKIRDIEEKALDVMDILEDILKNVKLVSKDKIIAQQMEQCLLTYVNDLSKTLIGE